LRRRCRRGCALGALGARAEWTRQRPRASEYSHCALRAYVAETAGAAARFLAKADGPRVGAAGFVGWDTHINEGAASGQLANLLGALDLALAAIETNMGDACAKTVVAVVTEFGRTARINGTNGTDHGTGTVALLVGGALRGGAVIADWPGLKQAQLYEDRDPQTNHRSARRAQGPAQDHLRVDERVLATSVFPTVPSHADLGSSANEEVYP